MVLELAKICEAAGTKPAVADELFAIIAPSFSFRRNQQLSWATIAKNKATGEDYFIGQTEDQALFYCLKLPFHRLQIAVGKTFFTLPEITIIEDGFRELTMLATLNVHYILAKRKEDDEAKKASEENSVCGEKELLPTNVKFIITTDDGEKCDTCEKSKVPQPQVKENANMFNFNHHDAKLAHACASLGMSASSAASAFTYVKASNVADRLMSTTHAAYKLRDVGGYDTVVVGLLANRNDYYFACPLPYSGGTFNGIAVPRLNDLQSFSNFMAYLTLLDANTMNKLCVNLPTPTPAERARGTDAAQQRTPEVEEDHEAVEESYNATYHNALCSDVLHIGREFAQEIYENCDNYGTRGVWSEFTEHDGKDYIVVQTDERIADGKPVEGSALYFVLPNPFLGANYFGNLILPVKTPAQAVNLARLMLAGVTANANPLRVTPHDLDAYQAVHANKVLIASVVSEQFLTTHDHIYANCLETELYIAFHDKFANDEEPRAIYRQAVGENDYNTEDNFTSIVTRNGKVYAVGNITSDNSFYVLPLPFAGCNYQGNIITPVNDCDDAEALTNWLQDNELSVHDNPCDIIADAEQLVMFANNDDGEPRAVIENARNLRYNV